MLANVLLVAAVTPWILRHRIVSLRQLFLFQLIGALEALTIRWTGTLGVAGAVILAGLVVVAAKYREHAP